MRSGDPQSVRWFHRNAVGRSEQLARKSFVVNVNESDVSASVMLGDEKDSGLADEGQIRFLQHAYFADG
jgi:hypothetical protein